MYQGRQSVEISPNLVTLDSIHLWHYFFQKMFFYQIDNEETVLVRSGCRALNRNPDPLVVRRFRFLVKDLERRIAFKCSIHEAL